MKRSRKLVGPSCLSSCHHDIGRFRQTFEVDLTGPSPTTNNFPNGLLDLTNSLSTKVGSWEGKDRKEEVDTSESDPSKLPV